MKPGTILRRDEARALARRLKEEGKTLVFTNGCFDILHRGHVHLLREAKKLGHVLVVGINDDASVRRLKGKARPVNALADRAEVLGSVRYVDCVVPFSEDTPLELIKSLRPDVLVKGGDWKKEDVVGREFVESYGGKVVIIPYLEGYSTTDIIARPD